MGHALARHALTASDFLAWEHEQPTKHEFVRGEVFAMTGATDTHVTVSLNVAIALREHLRGTPCRTYMSDMKLRVAAADCYFYPDVFVTCGRDDAASALVKSEAVLVVEVLSPATAAYDRGQKFADYRRLPTLAEYLLIDTETRRCDLYRKGGDGLWVLHPVEPGEPVQLACVDLRLGADALWAELEPDAPAEPPAA